MARQDAHCASYLRRRLCPYGLRSCRSVLYCLPHQPLSYITFPIVGISGVRKQYDPLQDACVLDVSAGRIELLVLYAFSA